jgi:addiction module HigA family antidote
MDGGFRHQGLEEIYRTGKRRRIGADHIGKCERILQLLEVAGKPGGYERCRLSLPRPARQAETPVGARDWELPDRLSAGRAKALCMSILKTTIREEVMERKNGLPPVLPGEIIKEDILPSVGLSVTAAAEALGVSRAMLHDIPAGRKPLSAILCLKVARLLGGSPEVWMRLQAAYGLKKSEQNKKVMARVARIVPVKLVGEVRA